MIRRGFACIAIAALTLAGCRNDRGLDDPANELPFGRVDVPVEGAKVSAQAPIAGWALDDRGVKEVRVYVDGHLVSHGALANDRPDVTKAFPQYARNGDRHGWTLIMAFDTPGPHSVVAQAVDSDGATRDIGTLNVVAVAK